MKYCSKCKKAFISEDYKVCPHCGSELEEVDIEEDKENIAQKTSAQTAPAEENNTDKNASITEEEHLSTRAKSILGFLVAILCIAGAIFFWNNSKDLREDDKYLDSYYHQGYISSKKYSYAKEEAISDLAKECYIPVTICVIGAIIGVCIGAKTYNKYNEEEAIMSPNDTQNNNESVQKSEDDSYNDKKE